jgi:ATP-binding cassette subfamily B protein
MSKTKPVQLNSKKALIKKLFYFVRPYKKKFFFSVFLSVFLAAMAPLRPFLIQLTINEGIAGKSSFFLNGPGAFILEVTLFQIILLLIETSARFYFTFSTASLGQHVVKDLRDATYSKILRLNLAQFDKTPIGTLTTRTVNDIESVNDIFSDGLIPILADFLSILSVLIYMFYTDWKITLICLIPFPILILATYFFKESVNKSFVKVRNAVASLNAFIQEHLSGMSVIQAFAAEEREMNKFKKINNEHRNANIKAIFAYSVFFPIVELVSALSIGLLVWWAAHQSFSMPYEESKNIAGVITSFILCINLLFRPLRMIADKFNVLQMGMIASERVFIVLDNEDVLKESEIHNQHFEENHILNGNINFSDVWFAYDEKNFVLKGINFEVESGKTLAIVGNTGSGKTTIVSLINRLYHIQKGSITIGGVDVTDFKIEELRSKIAVVLQDVFLFSGSVLDNMTLRNPEISRVMAIEAAKNIGLHDFIMQLPENYDFNVMERGATLSTGQRQLLSFARALLYNPSILILDEATSSIDAESELLIQNAIDKVIKGRTSIIIAHRLSTIQKADKIIVLERGEIKEMGSHSELINKKGHYYELYQKQFSSDLV